MARMLASSAIEHGFDNWCQEIIKQKAIKLACAASSLACSIKE
jgi:hypothetical protein